MPVRRMAPAPRNPTPVTICAAIRVGSVGVPNFSSPRPAKRQDPMPTRAMVRIPAGWPWYSRSSPMATARMAVTKRRSAKSVSPLSGRASAPSGTPAGLVLASRLVRELGKVEAVDEVAEHGEALLVDRSLALVLVVRPLVWVRDDARRLHHLGGDEDRAFDPHRQRDRVRRPGVEIEIAPVLLHVQACVEHLVGEAGHDDALYDAPQVAERGRHQVVGEGAPEGIARDLGRYRLGLEGADPDREVAVRLLLLEDHEVLGGRHMDPDAVDRDLDQVFHPGSHYY